MSVFGYCSRLSHAKKTVRWRSARFEYVRMFQQTEYLKSLLLFSLHSARRSVLHLAF